MIIHWRRFRIRLSVEGAMPFRARRTLLLAIATQLKPMLELVKANWIWHSHSNPGASIREWQRGINLYQAPGIGNRQERVGLQVRLMRHKLGLTQRELATKCQINRTHLGQIEKGRHRPNHATLYKLVEVLKLDPSAIQ